MAEEAQLSIELMGEWRRVEPIALPDFSAERDLIECELGRLLSLDTADNLVVESMRYAVFGGAQRIRPVLSLRVARLLQAETPAVVRAAAATELIHCASLVIDDLPCMDDSATRRGRPTVHIRFGESTAILAGFAMVALAARCSAGLSKFQSALLGVLDASALIKGQVLNLGELKTAPLFELAAEAGGVSSPDYDLIEPRLRAFARQYGMAFQAVDDVLDHDLDDLDAARRSVDYAGVLARKWDATGHQLDPLVDYLHVRLAKSCSHR